MNNPLLEWDALPPFSHIQAQDLESAVDAVLKENRATLAKLATLSTPDWQNFIEPQETLADRLHRAWAPAAHLNSVMSSKALREAYNACLARLAEYDTELGQNAALQRGYQAIKAGPEWAGYSPAQRKLVDDALRDFRLAGVDLPIDKKTRFREVMQELTQRGSEVRRQRAGRDPGVHHPGAGSRAHCGHPQRGPRTGAPRSRGTQARGLGVHPGLSVLFRRGHPRRRS